MFNPLRDIMERLGRRAADRPSPFRDEAEVVLNGFRESRREIEAQVRRGDLTPKIAREQAEALARGLGEAVKARAGEYSAAPRVFLDRLVEAANHRKLVSDRASLEGLQRETNRLLRSVLVEQQIEVRGAEFEGRAFTRSAVAGGKPAPTLDNLLAFHESALMAGDDAAVEWGRRQLESYRPLAADPEDHRRIDLATDRPDRINPRLVATYVEAMDGQPVESLERFVAESIAAKDANACMAAFVLARESSDGSRLRWVRQVLEGVSEFPDAALASLRELEVAARTSDREDAMAQAEFVVAQAEAEAKMIGIVAPSAVELARRAEIESRPVARLGEPIGLSLDRRGVLDGDPQAVEAPHFG